MKQPTKDALREQLALAATEIIRLREDFEIVQRYWAGYWESFTATRQVPRTWWRRWFA